MIENRRSITVLAMNTLAFTACFAVWTMNGVLVTFLAENGILALDAAQMGWLIGLPILTGSITRLPIGMLTDRFGGRWIFVMVMLTAAIPTYLISYATTYTHFLLGSLGFGVAGASFAVGIAYTSVWFKRERQGTALGVFGAGNAGAALTSLGAPLLLRHFTDNGANLEGWRALPQVYAAMLVGMAIVFVIFTRSRKPVQDHSVGLMENLAPLRDVRVWRFGLYYFLVFGGFVALAQWLIPYYVNVYAVSLATAGFLAMCFSLPSGVIRAIGGWASDVWGARAVMYIIFTVTLIASSVLILPPMAIETPGPGVVATGSGTVTAISEKEVVVGNKSYSLRPRSTDGGTGDGEQSSALLSAAFWQEPVVAIGDQVQNKQLLARGTTHINFPPNLFAFTVLVFVLGITTGIGKAAVYKHIAEYYPRNVGVVGGIVGVVGGLGGFFLPIVFGYLLEATRIWTTMWVFFAVLTLVCLGWMHIVVTRMLNRRAADIISQVEEYSVAAPALVGHAEMAVAGTQTQPAVPGWRNSRQPATAENIDG